MDAKPVITQEKKCEPNSKNTVTIKNQSQGPIAICHSGCSQEPCFGKEQDWLKSVEGGKTTDKKLSLSLSCLGGLLA
jgi:hypothetical protein